MMPILPYLSFEGTAEAAATFYAAALDGEVGPLMRWGDAPMPGMPPEMADKIMHVEVRCADGVLMASDAPPGRGEAFGGVSLSIPVADAATAERRFAALAEGGRIEMPLEKTFWAELFGMVTDRFGVRWMINLDAPADQPSDQPASG